MIDIRVDNYNFSEPWNIPFGKRFSQFLSGKIKIAYFYEQPNNSSFRYRTYNMTEALNKLTDGEISASYFFMSNISDARLIVEYADLLVVCRSRYSPQLEFFLQSFRSRGKKILFDIDDLVFDLDYVDVLIDSLDLDISSSQVLDDWFSYVGRMGKCLKMCDGAIATNGFLADRVQEFSNLPALVIPNFLNEAQQNYSNELLFAKKNGFYSSDGKNTIGYFSGSPSHNLDFKVVTPALLELFQRDSSINLFIAGYIEPDETLKKYSSRIHYHPFTDYVNLQKLIASVDVNIVPMQDNVFTNCKSNLKYFEASIVGVSSVATPVFTYRNSISNDVNGYLAQSHQWVDKIHQALIDSSPCSYVSEQARSHTLDNYSWDSKIENIVNVLFQFINK